MPDIVFLDTETLGLDPYAPIWELAAVRRNADTGEEHEMVVHVEHRPERWVVDFPEKFLADYRARYTPTDAITPYEAAHTLNAFCYGKPTLVGANPAFDTERIARQWLEPLGIDRPWHYHLMDIEAVAIGYLKAQGMLPPGPWKSDQLSALLGVSPDDYPRHTAMGDVNWVMAQWDTVFGKGSTV